MPDLSEDELSAGALEPQAVAVRPAAHGAEESKAEALPSETWIKQFFFSFANKHRIGDASDGEAERADQSPCTVELLLGSSIRRILIQKAGTDSIKSVIIMQENGHVTPMNTPAMEGFFCARNWRVFDLDPAETLIDIRYTDSFSRLELIVCRLPEPRVKTR